MYTSFRHETHGSNGRNIESIELGLSEILPIYVVDNCISQLRLPATNTAYLVGLRGHRKLTTVCGKFAVVSCRIFTKLLWKAVVHYQLPVCHVCVNLLTSTLANVSVAFTTITVTSCILLFR